MFKTTTIERIAKYICVSFFVLFLTSTLILPIPKFINMYSWQSAKCRIIQNDKTPKAITSNRFGNQVVYDYRFEYEYFYDGKYYIGNRYSMLGSKYAELFKVGDELTCYVNPQKPYQAIIVRDYPMSILILNIVLVGFAVLAFVFRRQNARIDSEELHQKRRTSFRMSNPLK